MSTERWDNDGEGELDDVCVPDVTMFRLERMDNNFWWIGLYKKDGTLVHIDIIAEQSGIVATKRED